MNTNVNLMSGCRGIRILSPGRSNRLIISMLINNRITIFSLMLFFTMPAAAQLMDATAFFKGTYNKDVIVRNNIRQISVEVSVEGRRPGHYIFKFDHKGFLQSEIILDSLGKKIDVFTFKYNEYGDQVERKDVSYEFGKTSMITISRTYRNARLIEERSTEFPYIVEYFYAENGQLSKTVTRMDGDTLDASARVSIYKYSAAGRLESISEITGIQDTSNAAITTTYVYDANDKIVSVLRSNAPTYTISYNQNGFLSSEKVKMPDDLGGLTFVDNYTYTFWE